MHRQPFLDRSLFCRAHCFCHSTLFSASDPATRKQTKGTAKNIRNTFYLVLKELLVKIYREKFIRYDGFLMKCSNQFYLNTKHIILICSPSRFLLFFSFSESFQLCCLALSLSNLGFYLAFFPFSISETFKERGMILNV